MRFGEKLKRLRKARRITLREFSKITQLDAVKLSRVERSMLPPPCTSALDRISKAFELSDEEKQQFFELAERDMNKEFSGELSNSEVLKNLPILCRIKGDLNAFVEKIRRT